MIKPVMVPALYTTSKASKDIGIDMDHNNGVSLETTIFELENDDQIVPVQLLDSSLEPALVAHIIDLFTGYHPLESMLRRAIHAAEPHGCINRLAEYLSRVGAYSVQIATSKGATSTGSRGGSSFDSLRNQFLIVEMDGGEFLVDPSFKDHFTIQDPTSRYQELLQLVPDVMVAPRTRLNRAVQLLATEMKRCFDVKELSLPPWRKEKALLSKWEVGSKRLAQSRGSGGGGGGGPGEAMTMATATLQTKPHSSSNAHEFVSRAFSSESPVDSPSSVLEQNGDPFGAENNSPNHRHPTIVGFVISTKRDECICCDLKRRNLPTLLRYDARFRALKRPYLFDVCSENKGCGI